MKGLYALLAFACFCTVTLSQSVTRYRNPWVELVRQISCRSVTCNFQETCDLQVVCTPFGDCGQRATCLQIPFPRNTVCPDPFTNAGPPYTVECFDDSGCQEPMVCCHSYAKSYCHMPPFPGAGGAAAGGSAPQVANSIVVEPVSESTLMNQGSTRNTPTTNTNTNQNADTNTSGNRGSRSVIVARSDFFDPQGARVQQIQNWQNSVDRIRRQQLDSLNSSIRPTGDRRDENEINGLSSLVTDDGFRANLRRNLDGGRLTVEISGQGEPGSRSFVDVNGVRIIGSGGAQPVQVGVGGSVPRADDSIGRTGNDVRDVQDDRGVPSRGVVRDDVRRPQATMPADTPTVAGGAVASGRPGAPGDARSPQGAPGAQTGANDVGQVGSVQGSTQIDGLGAPGGPTIRVNVHGGTGPQPFIRKVDLFKGHGFYGDRRRVLGDVQLDGFGGFANRFTGILPNTQRLI